jgi:hypothetical protein
MEKRKILVLIITFIFFQNIFSQSDYRKGFIITKENDTINGFIDYREGDKNYTSFNFRTSEKLNHTTYNSKQVKAYGFVNDKFYESKIIPSSTKTTENAFYEELVKEKASINNLKDGFYVNEDDKKIYKIPNELKEIANSTKKIEYAFFEVLVRGKASLYKFKDAYYVEKDDNKMYKLSNEIKGEIHENGRIYQIKSNRYIGILLFLFSDCSEIKKKINNLELRERSLTNIVEQYNNCVGSPSISYKESKPWFKTHFGLILGASSSKLNFYSDYKEVEYLTKGFDGSNSIMPGLYFDFLSPRIHERVAFHISIFYLSSKFVSFSTVESISSIYRNDVTIELDQLKFPMGIKYTFLEKNFAPYFNLGFSYTYFLKASSLWIQERERNNIVTTFINNDLNIGNSHIGFWGGVGFKKSIVNGLNGFLEIRYERTTGDFTFPISIVKRIENSIVNFQLLVGISF